MKKHLNIILPIIYLILCLIISFNRVPFWDEARAWLIAQNCNPIEFLSLMKLECHLSLWYLAIFPVAKLNLFYPYSIYIINTLFAFFSILILFKKSPFNLLEKSLIAFGIPFLLLWGSVARCYAIGILFLFLALSFYKIRAKKPYIYLILLCLCSHTSVMAFIGSFFLIIIFLFEKRKHPDFIRLFGIFILSNILIFIQIFDPNPDYLKQAPEMMFLRDFIGYILNPIIYIKGYELPSLMISLLRTSVVLCAMFFLYFTIKNNKKVLLFIISSYFSMVILFTFFYSGNFWHYFYFYLYFIVAMWILKLENKEKMPKILNVLFCAILILFFFKSSLFVDSKLSTINNSTSSLIAKEIKEKFSDKKLFCLDPWSDIAPSALPFLNKITIYDKNNQNRKSFQSMRNQIKFNTEFFNPDDFAPYVDDNSLLLTTTAFLNHELKNPLRRYDEKTKTISFTGKKYTVSFVPYKHNEKICLWTYLIKINK